MRQCKASGIIKQPIRKAWQNEPNGSVFITVPKELGIRDGDFVVFEVQDGQITLRKLEVEKDC